MRLTPGRNPRSAMWSASSRTVTSMSSRRTWRWFMRSSRRPGHATTMSTPRRNAATWRPCETPPKTVVVVMPSAFASGSMVSNTCVASSRVGSRTSARGWPGRTRRPDVARRATSGSANAIVLPLPVRPRPSTSRPARESGSVADWIGKAEVMPWAARTRTRSAGTPSSANDVVDRSGGDGLDDRGGGRGRGGGGGGRGARTRGAASGTSIAVVRGGAGRARGDRHAGSLSGIGCRIDL